MCQISCELMSTNTNSNPNPITESEPELVSRSELEDDDNAEHIELKTVSSKIVVSNGVIINNNNQDENTVDDAGLYLIMIDNRPQGYTQSREQARQMLLDLLNQQIGLDFDSTYHIDQKTHDRYVLCSVAKNQFCTYDRVESTGEIVRITPL